MPVEIAPAPPVTLQRIGRAADPLACAPLEVIREKGGGSNRFDDPWGANAAYAVIYAAEQRRACFEEVLDQYRPDSDRLAEFFAQHLPPADPDDIVPPLAAEIPYEFFLDRRIGFFRLESGQTFLDCRLSATATAHALSTDPRMVPELKRLGHKRIKPGDFVGSDRRLTQAVS